MVLLLIFLRDRLYRHRCPERICYKLCFTVFKALHGMEPGYIADLCLPEVISERRSTLRSSLTSGVRLAVPRRSCCTRFGDRACCVAGPTAWDSLPESIRLIQALDAFKQLLKTYLFVIICTVFVKRLWDVIFTVWRYKNYPIHHNHHHVLCVCPYVRHEMSPGTNAAEPRSAHFGAHTTVCKARSPA